MFKHLGRITALVALSFLLSGCFLRTLIGGVGVFPEDEFLVHLEAGSNAAICLQEQDEEGTTTVECTYWLVDTSEELFLETTSTVELISELGWFGVLIDPLILQAPDDVTDVTGTFTTDSAAGNLMITVTNSFAADALTTVTAEPGNTFLIIELPDSVATSLPPGDARTGMAFDFDLQFRLASVRAIQVKPVNALRIEIGGEVYYAPMAPCVTDFADVPAIEIPVAATSQDLYAQAIATLFQAVNAGIEACDGVIYNFDPVAPPPDATHLIDIMPGSASNAINLTTRGVIPVAILSTSDFDATTVDWRSVCFGDAEEASQRDCTVATGIRQIWDVNRDGRLDLVLAFDTFETGIDPEDTQACLTGETVAGVPIAGCDDIQVILFR